MGGVPVDHWFDACVLSRELRTEGGFGTRWTREALARSIVAIFLLAATAFPQNNTATTTDEFWPEFDLYVKLSEKLRLVVFEKKERDSEDSSVQSGAAFEMSFHRFRPLLFRKRVEVDDARMKLMTFRAGYLYKTTVTEEPPVHENRGTVDWTLRWFFPGDLLLSNRARFEFRFQQHGQFSWRYRDRLRLEKDLHLGTYTFTTYVAAEPFYNSADNSWDRFRLTGGTVLPLGKKFSFEPYYTRQHSSASQPHVTNAFGLMFEAYF